MIMMTMSVSGVLSMNAGGREIQVDCVGSVGNPLAGPVTLGCHSGANCVGWLRVDQVEQAFVSG